MKQEKELIEYDGIETIDIDPQKIVPTKKQEKNYRGTISLYIIMTISVLLFSLAFILVDFGIALAKSEAINTPVSFFNEILEINFQNKDGITEVLTSRLFGISFERLEKYRLEIKKDNLTDVSVDKDETNISDDKEHYDKISSDSEKENEVDNVPTDNGDLETENKNYEEYPIVEIDLSQKNLGIEYITNETGYTPNVSALLNIDSEIEAYNPKDLTDDEKKAPIVLILHTHGTEAYSDEDSEVFKYYGGDFGRTTDTNKNIVAVGRVMAEVLNEEGISTIHCEIMHDEGAYQTAYTRAAETIKKYLNKYPSIKYVFDIHRDAVIKSDGTVMKPITEINGEMVAQVMAVVGSDYKGGYFPDWEKHLSIALKLREKLNAENESLCRPVYLRGATYNEQYSEGGLLIEVGSIGNTLDEAKRAGIITAKMLAEIIKGK